MLVSVSGSNPEIFIEIRKLESPPESARIPTQQNETDPRDVIQTDEWSSTNA